MLDRKFEKFLGQPTQPSREVLYVSISPNRVIRFNENCYRQLGKPLAAYLYFSRVDDTIAIEPAGEHRLPSAFPLKRVGDGGWRINAAPFCKHFRLRFDTTERFIAPEIRDGVLHLKLRETVSTCQPPTRKRRS